MNATYLRCIRLPVLGRRDRREDRHLDEGCKAVGCAGGVGHDVSAGVEISIVDSHDVGGDVWALGWCCDQNLLGTCLDVLSGTFPVQEHSCSLNHQVNLLQHHTSQSSLIVVIMICIYLIDYLGVELSWDASLRVRSSLNDVHVPLMPALLLQHTEWELSLSFYAGFEIISMSRASNWTWQRHDRVSQYAYKGTPNISKKQNLWAILGIALR